MDEVQWFESQISDYRKTINDLEKQLDIKDKRADPYVQGLHKEIDELRSQLLDL